MGRFQYKYPSTLSSLSSQEIQNSSMLEGVLYKVVVFYKVYCNLFLICLNKECECFPPRVVFNTFYYESFVILLSFYKIIKDDTICLSSN